MKDHELKSWPTYFSATIAGYKKFEFRLDDRGFQVGDTLWLREWEPSTKSYTGRNIRVLVTSLWTTIPGVPEDHCIMGIKIVQAPWTVIEEKENRII